MAETTLTDGTPVTPDHREIDPQTGMQKGYVVLSEDERAKGFVRPVRDTYRHVGLRPQYPTRPLTADERERLSGAKYEVYEQYPPALEPKVGKYWKASELFSGCGGVTTMHHALAETYARDPGYYGGTFCAICCKHFPVAEFVWVRDGQVVGS